MILIKLVLEGLRERLRRREFDVPLETEAVDQHAAENDQAKNDEGEAKTPSGGGLRDADQRVRI